MSMFSSHSFILQRAALCGLVLGAAFTGWAQTPAFPGAQGFGRFATGGRGGSVYYVTTTNDTGPGSFREAVSQANRTVVFAVSGVIDYQPPRYNIKNNVTIAGQTAPGDGVVLYGDGIGYTDASHTITRFIRFRMGQSSVGEDTVGIARGHNMIFDHISATWSLDEVFSVSGSPDPTNITLQASIVGQGLEDHSAGGLIQTDGGVSILRSLYIDNGTRNPKVKGVNEFVNNVVYNWTTDAYILGDSAGESFANVIGNYFINGPNTGNDGAFSRGNLNFKLYATDNWQDKDRDGTLDGLLLTQPDYDANDWQTTAFAYPVSPSNALPALTAVKVAVSDVGPSWRRDTVDERLITELTSWGALGQTIFNEFEPPMSGPGPYKGGPVPLDTDLDGMPDYWEAGLGLATNAPNNNDASAGGYTKLEDYLNWLAEPHGVALTNMTVLIDLRQFTRGFTNFNPVYAVTGASNGTVTLTNGWFARFVPAAGFVGQAGFGFSVVDGQGSEWSRPFGLFFTPQPPAYGRVWRGDGVSNLWNVQADANWFDDQALRYPFQNGTSVEFDDAGSTSPAVNLVGSVQPAAVWVNATKDYTFGGAGSLDGAMNLIKTRSGTLTLANTNGFTGGLIVSNGTLLVNGALPSSAVTVRAGATLGGHGRLGVAPVLNNAATLAPGGVGAAGALTISNALTLAGGVTNRFDLSDDPSGLTKTNDRIHVVGTLNLSGVNVLRVTLLDGPLANGVYPLITYSNLTGSMANLTLVGANGVLTNPPGAIAIHVDNTRPPAALVWSGNGSNNQWDNGTTPNWMNGGLPDWFYFGDTVRFDDSGSMNPPVNLAGTLTPESVMVDAAGDYTFSGTGKIGGTGGLTKTNTGTLTILTTNEYSGVTTIAGGIVSVARFVSNAPSALGAATTNAENLILRGGATLRYTGANGTTERGMTLGPGGGGVDVTVGGTVLTWSGVIVGGGALTKTGAGRLDATAVNGYSGGTVVNAGDVRLVNTDGFGTGPIALNGSSSNAATFRFGADTQTVPNKLIINGTNNFVLIRGNNTLSQLEGSGTFQAGLVDSGTTLTFGGSMTGFTGTFRAGNIGNPRFHGSTGSSNALFDLGSGSAMLNSRGPITAHVGALMGGPNTYVRGAESADGPSTYYIGGKNLDTVFNGQFRDRVAARSLHFVKVGAGTLTLTGASTHTGTNRVDGGTLLVCNTSGSGTGTNNVLVNNSGTLGGTGSILASVFVNSGGTLAPGSNSVGTLTIRSNLTLNAGAVLRFELGATNASDRVVVSNAVVLNGTLHLTNVAGFGAGTYTLIKCGGSLTGPLPALGSSPAGYGYALNTSTPGELRLVVTALPLQPQTSLLASGGTLTLGGTGGAAGRTYHVLASTNVTLPLVGWSRLATNQFDFYGSAQPLAIVPEDGQRYFRLHLP